MSGHLELGPNQRPDMKRKIVVVGDGELPPCVFDLHEAELSVPTRCYKAAAERRAC